MKQDPRILQDPVRVVSRILKDPGILQDPVRIGARILKDPGFCRIQ